MVVVVGAVEVEGNRFVPFVYRSSAIVLFACLFGVSACTHLGGREPEMQPLRLSQLAAEGDAARRASLRLVVEGLDADVARDSGRAQSRYQRALVVDATNPYAYLAISRQHVEAHDFERALQFLDRAEALLRMQGELADEVAVHLDGLRGGALYDAGDVEASAPLLDRARSLAPSVWGDGELQADELR